MDNGRGFGKSKAAANVDSSQDYRLSERRFERIQVRFGYRYHSGLADVCVRIGKAYAGFKVSIFLNAYCQLQENSLFKNSTTNMRGIFTELHSNFSVIIV